MRAGRFTVSVFLAGLLLGSPSAAIAGGAKKKPPKASSVLVKSLKALQKSRGYRATLEVSGGVTSRRDHRVAAPTVRRNYTASVYGGMMSLSSPQVYRTQKKGAIRHDGSWKALLSANEGVTVDRLFSFPEELLVAAIKNRGTAKWHISKTKKKSGSGGKTDRAAKSRGETKKGKTVVVDKKKDDGDVEFPGRIRVEAPPKEALQKVLVVQNSGCFGGG